MKKSNLILLGALGAAIFFSLVFQLSVHSNVKKEKANEVPVEVVSESRTLSLFDGILIEDRISVVFRQSETSKVVVNAPNYIIDSVITETVDRNLIIKATKKLKKKDSIHIQIDHPTLTALELHNNSHFEADGQISGGQLNLIFKDNSSANLNLDYDAVKYTNNTQGKVNLQGEIKKIDLVSDKE
ncbi:MAG: DUF2807 domain-containing protein [Allomuricauda sp.]